MTSAQALLLMALLYRFQTLLVTTQVTKILDICSRVFLLGGKSVIWFFLASSTWSVAQHDGTLIKAWMYSI